MRCRMLTLTMLSVSVALSGCAARLPVPVDSYCQLYTPVCTKKGECSFPAASATKRKLLANEMLYDTCPKD